MSDDKDKIIEKAEPTEAQVQCYLDTLYTVAGGKKSAFLERIDQVKDDLGFTKEHPTVVWVLDNWEWEPEDTRSLPSPAEIRVARDRLLTSVSVLKQSDYPFSLLGDAFQERVEADLTGCMGLHIGKGDDDLSGMILVSCGLVTAPDGKHPVVAKIMVDHANADFPRNPTVLNPVFALRKSYENCPDKMVTTMLHVANSFFERLVADGFVANYHQDAKDTDGVLGVSLIKKRYRVSLVLDMAVLQSIYRTLVDGGLLSKEVIDHLSVF